MCGLQIFSVLLNQQARHAILQASLRQERDRYKHLYALISAATHEINEHANALKQTTVINIYSALSCHKFISAFFFFLRL